MKASRRALEQLGWTEALAATPFSAGDARFLTRYFLPDHGRHRVRAYSALLAAMGPARAAADLAERGRVRRILGDEPGARGDFKAALIQNPRCAEALSFRGELTLGADPKVALADLDAALALAPDHRPSRLWRAYALAVLGRLRESSAALDELLAAGPSNCGILLRGMVRERLEDLTGAEADYSAALASDPGSPGLFTLRAAARCKRGDLPGAVADADRALTGHPENLDGYVRILYLAEWLNAAVDPRSEKDILVRATGKILSRDPACAWAHAVRAAVLGRSELQLDGLQSAVALAPRTAWMRAFLGRALSDESVGREREGLSALTEAARLSPKSGWILCWRAEVRRRLGDFAGARADLDAGLRLQPDYRLGFAWRAFLRDSRGDAAGGVEDMTVCLEVLPRTAFFHTRSEMRLRCGDLPGALGDLAACLARSTPHALAYSGSRWLAQLNPAALGPKPLAALLKARRLLRGEDMMPFVEAAGCAGAPLKFLGLPAAECGALWRGRDLLNAGDAQGALAPLAESEEPQFLARSWRGEALCRLGRPREALVELDAAIRLKPGFLPSILWRSAALLDLGRRAEGLAALVEAHDLDPAAGSLTRLWLRWRRPASWRPRVDDGPAARSALAELSLRAGNAARSRRLLARVKAGALDWRGLLVRGLARASGADWRAAESDLAAAVREDAEASGRLLASLLKSAPNLGGTPSVLAHLALVQAARARGRDGEAQRLSAVARSLAGEAGPEAPPDVLALKSEGLRLAGEFEAAAAVVTGVRSAAGLAALGRAQRQAGDSARALKTFRAAAKLAPRDGRIRAWEAECLRALGRPQARAAAVAALKLKDCPAWARALLGELERRRGRNDEAWRHIKEAFAADPAGQGLAELLGCEPESVRSDPANAWLYAWRGSLRRRQGRWETARADFDHALALDPDCFWGQAWRGECRLGGGDAGGAADLDAALAAHPGFAEARVWRGRALCEAGEFEAALPDFREALSQSPDEVLALVGAGVCLERLGKGAEGKRLLLRARRLAPSLFAESSSS